MPTYNLRNKETGEVTTEFMSISEMEIFEKTHPEIEVMCGTPLIHTGGGLGLRSMRTDDGFKSRLKEIAKLPGSQVAKRNVNF